MSARDYLHSHLMDSLVHYRTYEDSTLKANELINAFAHELAEKIRNSKELRDLTDDHMSDCYAAADLIDPELNDA